MVDLTIARISFVDIGRMGWGRGRGRGQEGGGGNMKCRRPGECRIGDGISMSASHLCIHSFNHTPSCVETCQRLRKAYDNDVSVQKSHLSRSNLLVAGGFSLRLKDRRAFGVSKYSNQERGRSSRERVARRLKADSQAVPRHTSWMSRVARFKNHRIGAHGASEHRR